MDGRRQIEPAPQMSLMDEFVPPAPGDSQFDELVRIALELVDDDSRWGPGVIVGEAVFVYEHRFGRQVGGLPMSDPIKAQRQTSWLPRVMRAAGLKALDATRRSPVARHHKHRHTIWVRPEIEG